MTQTFPIFSKHKQSCQNSVWKKDCLEIVCDQRSRKQNESDQTFDAISVSLVCVKKVLKTLKT